MSKPTGFITIHRKLFNSPIWCAEKFSKAHAWIDLINLAKYEPTYLYVRGIKVYLDVGELCWSEEKLCERWRWSRNKLRRFLGDLEKDNRIEQKRYNKKYNKIKVIKVRNYRLYQPDKKSKGTTEETIKGTTNETYIKEIKEDIKEKEKEKEKENLSPAMLKIWNEVCEEFEKKGKRCLTKSMIGIKNRIQDKKMNSLMNNSDLIGNDGKPLFQTLSDWKAYCIDVNNNAFLCGKSKTGWVADVNFCSSPDKIKAFLEGRYNTKRAD